MAQKFSNAARAYLSAGISDTDTTITISAGGSLFPTISGSDFCRAVLQDSTGIEIVLVTAHTAGSTSFTVTRGQEGTTARAFASGSVFGVRLTAADGDTFAAKVAGPASATDSALVAFDGTTGKLIKQASTVTVAQGGTGQTSYTDGQLLIGNSSGNTLTKATLTPGSGISITNGNGSISIASTASVSAATPTALGTVYGSMTTAGASPYLTALGYSAGNAATGIYNTFVGYQAGVVTSTGYRNTAIGANALAANTSGRYNTAIGDSALPANTTSHYSTAVGYQAGLVNTQPALVAIGAQALAANTSGDSNTACGYAALNANITGNYNTGIGREALTLSTGTNNTALGYLAGSSITSGSNNIVIGSSAAASSATVSNETTIGSSSTTSFRAFGDLKLQRDYTEKVVTANTGTAYTIDITNGTVQILTLTGNCTFTFPTATAGKSFMFLLKQDATGSRTVTWPAAVKWPGGTAPTITATANKMDKFVFTADGTNWIGSNAGQNYL